MNLTIKKRDKIKKHPRHPTRLSYYDVNLCRDPWELEVKKKDEYYDEDYDEYYDEYLLPRPTVVGYDVQVGCHKIITVYTYARDVAVRWMQTMLRRYSSGKIVVGVSLSRKLLLDDNGSPIPVKYGVLLQLCVGTDCLIYEITDPDIQLDEGPTPFPILLGHPRVFCAGVNMKRIALLLANVYGVKVSNVVDLNIEAEVYLIATTGIYTPCVWMDMNVLAATMLGFDWFVDRPVDEADWFSPDKSEFWISRELEIEKAKVGTYDAFASLVLGINLLEKKDTRSIANAFLKLNLADIVKKKAKIPGASYPGAVPGVPWSLADYAQFRTCYELYVRKKDDSKSEEVRDQMIKDRMQCFGISEEKLKYVSLVRKDWTSQEDTVLVDQLDKLFNTVEIDVNDKVVPEVEDYWG